VFFAVMLESVVATVVAGFVGIVLAIILVRNEFVMQYIAPRLTDIPPFPGEVRRSRGGRGPRVTVETWLRAPRRGRVRALARAPRRRVVGRRPRRRSATQ